MDLMSRDRAIGGALAGALLASLAVASNANAATYYGCINKKSGVLRIIPKSKKCKKSERRISFNSQGTAGRNGFNGANGANGHSRRFLCPGRAGLRGSYVPGRHRVSSGFPSLRIYRGRRRSKTRAVLRAVLIRPRGARPCVAHRTVVLRPPAQGRAGQTTRADALQTGVPGCDQRVRS